MNAQNVNSWWWLPMKEGVAGLLFDYQRYNKRPSRPNTGLFFFFFVGAASTREKGTA
jgi:hypothetical protein